MYQQYRDFPRLDQPVPTLARLHMQDLHRQADHARLARLSRIHASLETINQLHHQAGQARLSEPEEVAAPVRTVMARRILHMLRAALKGAAVRIGVVARAHAPVVVPEP